MNALKKEVAIPYWQGYLCRHPFLWGMGSVLDLAGHRRVRGLAYPSDMDSIASDFTAIGDDMRAVLNANPLPADADGQ
jgi:hypothetical protein